MMFGSLFAIAAPINELYLGLESEYNFNLKELDAPFYEHSSNKAFFDGAGAALGMRLGVGSNFGFGITGQVGWRAHTIDRLLPSTKSESCYSFSTKYGLLGYFVTFGGNNLSFLFEYYPINHAQVTYSDDKSINPFRKDNELFGKGWAGGISFNRGVMSTTVLFRHREFNWAELNGLKHEIPDSTYKDFYTQEIVVQMGASF